MPDVVVGLLRHVLTALFTWGAMKLGVDEGSVAGLVAAALAVANVIWMIVTKKGTVAVAAEDKPTSVPTVSPVTGSSS